MGLLNGLKKVKRYIKLSDGYKLLSIWTSSQSVEMDDGSTLESNKPNWDDKYTKSEVDNKLSAIETNIDWKESVDTFADIASAYPDPQDGWTVNVKDTDYTYRYSGEEWVVISANAIPKATQSVDGLLTKEDKISYDSAVTKKHEHDNKSVLDGITSEKVERWDESSTSSVTGIKGNKEENYRSGNVNITPADIGAVDKSGDTMTGALTAPTFHGNLEGTFHGMSDNQIFRGNVEWGWRNPEWTEDVNGWVLPGCYGVSDSCIHLPPNIASPWGNLLVFPSMEGRILQIYYDWNDPDKVYHRAINGTTASNWMIFSDDSYGTCTTAAHESTMEISSETSHLRRTQKMTIYFVNGCDAGTKYLKINGQTAIRMYCQGGDLSYHIPRGSFVEVIFIDGAAYLIESRSNDAKTLMNEDTRYSNSDPNWYQGTYPRRTVTEFKNCTSIGLNASSAGDYCTLETSLPWSDNSGGYAYQIAKTNSGAIFTRTGTSGSTWGSWKRIDIVESMPVKCDSMPANLKSVHTKSDFSWSSDNGYGSVAGNLNDSGINSSYVQYSSIGSDGNASGRQGYRILKEGYYWLRISSFSRTISPGTSVGLERVKRVRLDVYPYSQSSGESIMINGMRATPWECIQCHTIAHLAQNCIIVPVLQIDPNGSTVISGTFDYSLEIMPLFIK